MSNNLSDNLNLPDLSPLFAFTEELQTKLSSMMEPLKDTIHKMDTIMKPLQESIKNISVIIDWSGLSSSIINVTRTMDAIHKLGNAQFVYWDFLTQEFIDEIVDSVDVNITLENLYLSDNQHKTKTLLEKLQEHPQMERHKMLLNQIEYSAQNGNYDLAIIGLTSIFDGLLSDVTGDQTTRLAKRSKTVLRKLEENETIDSDEYAILTLTLTYEKAIGLFIAYSDFSKEEPPYLNRHWIMHGRSAHPKTALDYLKLLHIIYGLLLIKELGDKGMEVYDE